MKKRLRHFYLYYSVTISYIPYQMFRNPQTTMRPWTTFVSGSLNSTNHQENWKSGSLYTWLQSWWTIQMLQKYKFLASFSQGSLPSIRSLTAFPTLTGFCDTDWWSPYIFVQYEESWNTVSCLPRSHWPVESSAKFLLNIEKKARRWRFMIKLYEQSCSNK